VLVSIPFWEWSVLRGAKQKQQYLLFKLQAAVKAGSSSRQQSSPCSTP
jgi:hypothetical protein